MTNPPRSSRYLLRLAEELFTSADQREAFTEALRFPQPFPSAVIWTKPRPFDVPFQREDPLAWQAEFVDRVAPDARPGGEPLHEQGSYYCLDFSSVFAASVLTDIATEEGLVLDLCASPGGKAVYTSQALRPKALLCNEVIGKRIAPLVSNLKRCSIPSVSVTSADPAKLSSALAYSARLVIVDAPCSGQSLAARGRHSPGCFHPATINMNSNRQKRIIANAATMVASGGWLAYMTCTFSPKENERVVEWLVKKFPAFEPVEVAALKKYRSEQSQHACYRMWPHDRLGAGSFTCLLRNTSKGNFESPGFAPIRLLWSSAETNGE